MKEGKNIAKWYSITSSSAPKVHNYVDLFPYTYFSFFPSEKAFPTVSPSDT